MAFDKYSEKNLTNFWKNVAKSTEPNGCWLWTGSTDNKGYGHIGCNGKTIQTHRMSFEIHNKREIGAGLVIAHLPIVCHNPLCVRLEHLREATYSENQLDKHIDGTMAGAKLTAEQVLEIRASNKSQKDLALEYGTNSRHISKIILRQRWKHLPEAPLLNTISHS